MEPKLSGEGKVFSNHLGIKGRGNRNGLSVAPVPQPIMSEQINLAEFGLCFENEAWAGQNIPSWDMTQPDLQGQQVQWLQQEPEIGYVWPGTALEAPINQLNLNQGQSVGQQPQNHQLLQNFQYSTLDTTASQFQQQPGNQVRARTNQAQFNNGSSHRAQITIVHAPSGNSRAIIKRKRKRTAFTTDQILALEQVFRKKPYVNREDRQVLVEKLRVSDRAIKVWFQNRRIKSKREEMEASSSDFSPIGSESSDSFGLAYVEAQMSQRTDEFGFVTLDDRAIGELVNVIDTLVSENVRFDMLSQEAVEKVLQMEYEPISPAANSDCSEEEAAKWRPPEPEQSLRQLLDIQHFC